MSTAAGPVPDVMVLAAIERAARHSSRGAHEVPMWEVKAHLGLPRRSRRIFAQLDALEAAGLIMRSRALGMATWTLTSVGRRRLQRARRVGEVPMLPESPQHGDWRKARTIAAREIEGFEMSVRECLSDAVRLLEADPPTGSDAWFAIAERAERACRRLASAIHCLHEWREPDDARADVDDRVDPTDRGCTPAERVRRRARRVGRRNVFLWRSSIDGMGR